MENYHSYVVDMYHRGKLKQLYGIGRHSTKHAAISAAKHHIEDSKMKYNGVLIKILHYTSNGYNDETETIKLDKGE